MNILQKKSKDWKSEVYSSEEGIWESAGSFIDVFTEYLTSLINLVFLPFFCQKKMREYF